MGGEATEKQKRVPAAQGDQMQPQTVVEPLSALTSADLKNEQGVADHAEHDARQRGQAVDGEAERRPISQLSTRVF